MCIQKIEGNILKSPIGEYPDEWKGISWWST